MLGGLGIWAAHFFLLYIIASLLPGQHTARLLALLVSLPALAGDVAILWMARRMRQRSEDDLDRWILTIAALGAALSIVAVVWQAMPAVLA